MSVPSLRSAEGIVVSLERPGMAVTPPERPVEMDQKDMRFVPHVLPVVTGTTVRFLNSDPEPHNVYSPEGRYNLGTWPPGDAREHRFERAGEYTQLCRVHPEMLAHVVVRDTPHLAVTDAQGHFELPQVPPGRYTLVAWSERLGRREVPLVVGGDGDPAVEVSLEP